MQTITEKSLPWPVHKNVMSWCPTMDLIVFIPNEQGTTHHVSLYRLSGQKVWTTNSKRSVEIAPLKSIWRPDGKSLAILYEDNVYQIFNTANGKIIHTSTDKITTALAWTVEDIGSEQKELLPSNLFDVDYTKVLPRLPSIAATAASRNLPIDNTTGKTVALFLEGQKDGRLNINLYGAFDCGRSDGFSGLEVLDVVCSKDVSIQYLLLRDDDKVYVGEHQTPFTKRIGPKYLTEISVTPSAVLNLIDYLCESFKLMNVEVDIIRTTYKQFLLQKFPDHAPPGPIMPYYFDIALTGMLQPEIRHWLTEQTENGVRKLLKTGLVAFDNLIKLVFENVIQAYERILIYLSQLSGLAAWKDRGVILGLNDSLIKEAIATTSSQFKGAHGLLWAIKKERSSYQAFSAWIETLQEKAITENGNDYSRKPLYETSTVSTKTVLNFIMGLSEQGEPAWKNLIDNLDLTKLRSMSEKAFQEICKSLLRQTNTGRRNLLTETPGYEISLRMQNSTCYILMYKVNEMTAILGRMDGSTKALARLRCPGPIVQIEFVDDKTIIILHKESTEGKERHLLSTDYSQIKYIETSSDSSIEKSAKQVDETIAKAENERRFGPDFIAESFAINGAPGRRIGCILEASCQRYKFFDLDRNDEDDDNDIDE
jgi:hypothetical protein